MQESSDPKAQACHQAATAAAVAAANVQETQSRGQAVSDERWEALKSADRDLTCRRSQQDRVVMVALPRDSGIAAGKVVAFWDLPKQDLRSHELSGIAWDDRRKVLYAIADKTPRLTELVPDATFYRWRIGG